MPVNGSPMFSQPVWMSLPPPNQTHAMMRPVPYPGQMMSYPPPGGASLYAHHPQSNMQNPVSQQTGAPQGRGRGMPPMSPAMPHAAAPHVPMYPGSPVLMHVPSVHRSFIHEPSWSRTNTKRCSRTFTDATVRPSSDAASWIHACSPCLIHTTKPVVEATFICRIYLRIVLLRYMLFPYYTPRTAFPSPVVHSNEINLSNLWISFGPVLS
jgi:hypothetical protein